MGENKIPITIDDIELPTVKLQFDQQILDVISESGIKLQPDTVGKSSVSRKISRVWSTLWGWAKDRLVRVKCDKDGRVAITDFVETDTRICNVTGTIVAPASDKTIDLGFDCFDVEIVCYGSPVSAYFGMSSGNYHCRKLQAFGQPDAVGNYPSGYCRFRGIARFVRLESVFIGVNVQYQIVGHYNK